MQMRFAHISNCIRQIPGTARDTLLKMPCLKTSSGIWKMGHLVNLFSQVSKKEAGLDVEFPGLEGLSFGIRSNLSAGGQQISLSS